MNDVPNNQNSIIPIYENPDKLERELILKQLLFLRQDINEIKQYLLSDISSAKMRDTNSALFLPIDED